MAVRLMQWVYFTAGLFLCGNPFAAGITVEVVDVNNKAVAGLVVYLEPLENQYLQSTQVKPLIIYQSDKAFSPYVSVISKGAIATFSNKDDITHHIYSVASKNRFSFRIKSGSSNQTEPLSVTGKILMGCNIHDWMSGYLMIVDTPLYSKTNPYGETTLEIPVLGRYNLVVWHPQLSEKNQSISREITVTDGKHYQVRLTKEMAEFTGQENPDGFDFLDDY